MNASPSQTASAQRGVSLVGCSAWLGHARRPQWQKLVLFPLVPLVPIFCALTTASWAWDVSFAHNFVSDWFRFWRRATAQALTRSTFWPNSGWFYDDGMITWSWDSRATKWKDFGGRVSLRRH